MRIVFSVLVLMGLASPGQADETTRKAAEKAAHQMLEDAYLYMGVTYLCQDAIGSSHYYAARTATEHAARIGGKSETDSVILADDFDKRIKIDVPKKAPAANVQGCLDKLLESQTAFRVSKARFEKAAAADR